MADAVLFDMDGVIIDSEQYWQTRQKEALQRMLSPDIDINSVLAEIKGMRYTDTYTVLREQYGLEIDRDTFTELYEEMAKTIYQQDVQPMPGFKQLLEDVRKSYPRTAIASSSSQSWINIVLDRFDLHSLFDTVVSAGDIDGDGKPAPDIYLHTASILNVDPSSCIVIEDSPNGIQAAKSAKMRCIAFQTDSNRENDLSHADTVADGVEGLRRILL